MRYAFVMRTVIVAPLVAACSGERITQQAAGPARTAPSAMEARLLATSTGRLRPEVDSVALQRLLNALPPEARAYARVAFETHQGASMELTSENPSIQALIASVTPHRAPMLAARGGVGRMAWTAPVTLALVSGEGDTAVTVQRGVAANGGDIIVLHDGDLDARKVSAALRGLALLRWRDGAVASTSYSARLRVSQGPSESAAWIAYINRKLGELRAARRRVLPDVGAARLIVIDSLGR